MCQVLKVSRSGYYHYIHRDISNRATENSKIVEKIKCIHKQYFGVYGSPRIYEELKDNGYSCSKPRVALNGRKFYQYKFRTMVSNAEDLRKDLDHLNEQSGPVFKITKDPRITKLGFFLRKFSLDELPQLINVLKSDMNLIGPRPPIPSEVQEYTVEQLRRLSMKPGITGNWQVNGRNTLAEFKDWVKLDLEYIDNWSFSLDLKIILKTIIVVLSGTGK